MRTYLERNKRKEYMPAERIAQSELYRHFERGEGENARSVCDAGYI